jgi:phosphatidylserine decarboxylase
MTYISGEYYTVNPQAIRTQLDVYGENARKIVPIDTPTFGRVFCACIGAMMVGTIQTTVNEGDEIKRGQEFGYFAFGTSPDFYYFESIVSHLPFRWLNYRYRVPQGHRTLGSRFVGQ